MKNEKWTGGEIVMMFMLLIMTAAFIYVGFMLIAERRQSAIWRADAFTFCEKVARTMREEDPLNDYSCKLFARGEK